MRSPLGLAGLALACGLAFLAIFRTAKSKVESTPPRNPLKEHAGDRDLRQYEVMDLVGFNLMDAERASKRQAKVREFLWDHWKNRKLGAGEVHQGTDDTSSTSVFFVEPNADQWRIVEFNEFVGLDNYPPSVRFCESIERVEQPKQHSESPDRKLLKKIPLADPRPPEEFLIRALCSEKRTNSLVTW